MGIKTLLRNDSHYLNQFRMTFCQSILLWQMVLYLFPLPIAHANPIAKDGGIINFQAMMTDEKGVPYGTESPQKFMMRFSVTSEDTNLIHWQSDPIEVEVVEGIFSVRLGKFSDTGEVIDASVFTGNDGVGKRRFLHLEICVLSNLIECRNYNSRNYRGFYKKATNESFSSNIPESQIPVSGVPFVVSAVRVVGDDLKEGTLRISKDDDLDQITPDLTIDAQGSYSGLKLIHNQNVALFIHHTDQENDKDALITSGKGQISGSIYLTGANSNLKVSGKLESRSDQPLQGQLKITGKDSEGFAVQAGPIRSPVYQNLDGTDFQVSTTGLSVLHKIRLVDVDTTNSDQRSMIVKAAGRNVVQFDRSSSLELSVNGFIDVFGSNFRSIDISPASSTGIEAIGFYDNYQPSTLINYPYQIIPHGFSTINTLQLSNSIRLDFERLRGLIGTYELVRNDIYDWKPSEQTYFDSRIGRQTHKHDIRVGADADNLISKLNNSNSKRRIIERRIDDYLAFKFTDNGLSKKTDTKVISEGFSNLNIFDHSFSSSAIDLLSKASVMTDHRMIVGANVKGKGIFLDGTIQSDGSNPTVLLGSSDLNIDDLYFWNLADPARPNWMSLYANSLSLSDTLNLTDTLNPFSLKLLGNLFLTDEYNGSKIDCSEYLDTDQQCSNFTKFNLRDISEFRALDYTPIVHSVFSKSTVKGDMILSKAPLIRTSFVLTNGAFSRIFSDADNKDYLVDPDGSDSLLKNLNIEKSLEVGQDLFAENLRKSRTIEVDQSVTISNVLSGYEFRDYDNDQYRLDPFPKDSSKATRLRTLTIKADLKVDNPSRIGVNFISDSDMQTNNGLIINSGDFRSNNEIKAGHFEDKNESIYTIDINESAIINSLQVSTNLTADNINSSGVDKDLQVTGEMSAIQLEISGDSISIEKLIDYDNHIYSFDPSNASSMVSVIATSAEIEGLSVLNDLNLTNALTLTEGLSISNSLSSNDRVTHSGSITVKNASNQTTFKINSEGDIEKAGQLELNSELELTSPDSTLRMNGGLDQESESGQNIISSVIAYDSIYMLESSLEFQDALSITTDGEVNSSGTAGFATAITAGYGSLNSTMNVTGSILYFESTTDSLALMHYTSDLKTPLNIKVKNVSVTREVFSSNSLITPLLAHPDENFYIDPTGVTRLNIVSIFADSGIGGEMIISAPLYFSSIEDNQRPTLSIDLSGLTTISALAMRSASFTRGITLIPRTDLTAMKIRSSDDNHNLIKISDDIFILSNSGTIASSGNLDFSGNRFHIKSDQGLIFSTTDDSVPSIELTSTVMAHLVGKMNLNADEYHQHGVFKTIPLTDIIRRDINNVISSQQLFTVSGYAIYFQPTSPSNSKLMVQQNNQGDETLSISGNGVIEAVVFAGDGRNLKGVDGADIVDYSVTADDFATNSIQSDQIANNAITGAKISRKTISGAQFKIGKIYTDKIKNEALNQSHFSTNTLVNADFMLNVVEARHLARSSITSVKIASETLGQEKFASKSIENDNLVANAIDSEHFKADQIRLYHLSANSINAIKVSSLSIQQVDLATDSIGFDEIKTGAVSSRIVNDGAVTMSKIRTDAITSNKIVTGSLIHQDFKTAAITLSKVRTNSISSREIKNLSLQNNDFQDESITTDKLAPDSIRTNMIQPSEILSEHITSNAILVEHIVDKTIQTDEILNYSLQNEDFHTNTIDPSDIEDQTIVSSQINVNAVTKGKINSEGISFSRFQPFSFDTNNIKDGEVKSSHLAASSILSQHIIDATIKSEDIATGTIDALKIKDSAIKTKNISNSSITTDTILDSNVLRKHFVDDSIQSVDIAENSITTDRLQNGLIQSKHIVPGSLKSSDFNENSAVAGKFALDSINSDKIQNGSLVLADFADNSITEIKIAADTFETDRFNDYVIQTSHVSSRQITRSHIQSNAVTEEKIDTGVLRSARFGLNIFSNDKFALTTLTTAKFGDNSVKTINIKTNQIDSNIIDDGSIKEFNIASNQISSRAIDNSTITSVSINKFKLSSRVLKADSITDAKFKSRGITTASVIDDRAITGSKIRTDSLEADVIKDYSILAEDIATGAIINSLLKTNIITSGHIIDGALNSSHFTSGMILTRHVTANAIISSKIADQTLSNENFFENTIQSDRLLDGIFLNQHFQREQFSADEISGPLPVSLFRSASISGTKLKNDSITQSKIKSWSLLGIHFADEAVSQSKIMSDAIEARNLQDNSVTTAKISDQQIINRHLQNEIIETDHIIDGSLRASDLMTRSLPGSKFKSGAIHTRNVKDGDIRSEHLYEGAISGDLFQTNSILSAKIGSASITKDHVKVKTLEESKFTNDAVNASKIDRLFHLRRSEIASDTLTSGHFADQIIHPYHFPDNSITSSKISSVSGPIFANNTINANKIKNDAVAGIKILSNTFAEDDQGLIFTQSGGAIKRTSQSNTQSNVWDVQPNQPSDTRIDNDPSGGEFSFTDHYLLKTRAKSDGLGETTIKDFSDLRFDGIRNHQAVVFNNKIWIIGGRTSANNPTDEVWSSKEGVYWKKVRSNGDSNGFNARYEHAALVFDNKLWVMGGRDSNDNRLRDVWYSTDGSSWTRATSSAAWSARRRLAATVFNGKMFITGGNDSNREDDVWQSSDGSSWTEITKDLTKEYDDETVLMIQSDTNDGNTSFADLSDQNHTITRNGGTSHQTEQSKFGSSSIYFDGSGDYLSLSDDSDWPSGSGNFTIECWVYQLANNDYRDIISQATNSTNWWSLYTDDGNLLRFVLEVSDVKPIDLQYSSFSSNQWHHIAVTKAGTTYRLFVDGTLRDSTTYLLDFPNHTGNLLVGSWMNDTFFKGYLDDIRMVKGQALYTSNFTPNSKAYYRRWKVDQHQLVAHNDGSNDYVYLIGGQDDTESYSDNIWRSGDLKIWEQLKTTGTLIGLREHSAISFDNGTNNKIYIIAGRTSGGGLVDDVYSSSDGIAWSQETAAAEFSSRRRSAVVSFDDGTGSKMWLLGGQSSAANPERDIWVSSNGSSWSTAYSIDTIHDQEWYDTNDFYVIAEETLAGNRFLFKYKKGTPTQLTALESSIDILEIERKDSSNFLAIGTDGKLYYDDNETFDSPHDVTGSDYSYKNPLFAPNANYIYAIKIVNSSDHLLVKIPWNGGDNFGEETTIQDAFSSENVTFESVKFDSDGDEIFMLANIPHSASLDIYKISTEGTGLTTFSLSNLSGDFLVIDGDKYNPYIPSNTIESAIIKDRTIAASRIAEGTIKREDLKAGGIDGDSFDDDGLINSNIKDNSLTYSKWKSRSIDNIKLDLHIFETSKIEDRSLNNRVIANNSLTHRTIDENTFDSSLITTRELTQRVMRQEAFDNTKLDNDLTSDDFADGSFEGIHFSNLTSASIAGTSISERKFKTSAIQLKHFDELSLESEDLAINSLEASNFKTNQFEGNLLKNKSISYDKLADKTIIRANLADDSILTENIETSAIQSRHFTTDAVQSSHIANNAVTTRTLSPSAITSTELAEDSIARVQIKAEAITNSAIDSDTIESNKLNDFIFDSTHFSNNSIDTASRIVNGTINTQNLPFSAISESKVSDAVSFGANYLVEGALQKNITGITVAKVKDGILGIENISYNSITTQKINDNAINSDKLRNQAIKTSHFSSDSVTNASILDSEIIDADLAENTLLNSKFSTNIISNSHFENNSIEDTKLASNTFSNASIEDYEISTAKFRADGLIEEDFATEALTYTKIDDGVITSSIMVSNSLTARVIATNTFVNDDFGDNQIYSEHLDELTIQKQDMALNTIITQKLQDLSVDESKLFKVDDDTKLLIRSDAADGSTIMTDQSKSRLSVTSGGDAHHETDQKKFGNSSIYFDGDDDYLVVTDSSELTLGTSDFTFEMWLFNQGGESILVGKELDAANKYKIKLKGGNDIEIECKTGNSEKFKVTSNTDKITTTNWHHIAVVRSSNNIYIFIDGQLEESGTTSADGNCQSITQDMYIGVKDEGLGNDLEGYIDEFRFSKVARYTSNFTPPDAPFENIRGKKLKDLTLTNAELAGGFDQDYLSNNSLSSDKLADQAVTSVHIIDGTLDGDQFKDGTIPGRAFANSTLTTADIDSNAVIAGKFSTSIDIDAKIHSAANLSSAKLIDNAITSDKLSFSFTSSDLSKFADGAITYDDLKNGEKFTSEKVLDGSISITKIATDQLSNFASNTLTATDFDQNSSSDNLKIGRKQIKAGDKIESRQITTAKIDPSSALPDSAVDKSSIGNDDFGADSIASNLIQDSTITSKQLTDANFSGTTRMPVFNGSHFEALTSREIADDIFTATDFPDEYFDSHHISSVDRAKFQTDSITYIKIKSDELSQSEFATSILSDDSMQANSITSEKFANNILNINHLQDNAITGSKFAADTLIDADFDSSNTDGVFSGANVTTSVHQHEPYLFKRALPSTLSSYTLLQSEHFGRANFAYELSSSASLLETAQSSCADDKTQVCDINQLIDICRNSADFDTDNYFFSGEPVFMSEEGQDYFVFPMLKASNDCLAPADIKYDFYAEELVPVSINHSSKTTIYDIVKYANTYVVKIDDSIYQNDKAFITDSSLMSGSLQTDNVQYAHLVENPHVSNEKLFSFAKTKVKRVTASLGFTDSTTTFNDIRDLDFFPWNSGSTSTTTGIIQEGPKAIQLIDSDGNGEGPRDILLSSLPIQSEFPTNETSFIDWQNYQYRAFTDDGDPGSWDNSRSVCVDNASTLAAAHSTAELDFIRNNLGNTSAEFWLNYEVSIDTGTRYWTIADENLSRRDYYPDSAPGNGDNSKGYLSSSGILTYDTDKNTSRAFVCKKPLLEWPARKQHQALWFNNKIHILSGNIGGTNKITGHWYSDSNGENWQVYDDTAKEDLVKIHLRSDNNQNEQHWPNGSGNTHHYAYGGGPTHSTTQVVFGNSSVFFDGTNDSIEYDDHADWDTMGSNDWTFDAWLHPTDDSSSKGKKGIIGRYSDSSNYWSLRWQDRTTFTWSHDGTSVHWTLTTEQASNKWYHVALTKKSSTYELFLDGVKQTPSASGNASFATNWNAPIRIGKATEGSNTSEFWMGYMQEARLTIGKRRWTHNFNPPKSFNYGMYTPRQGQASVVFNSKIWVFGGRATDYQNDIWSTSDGKTWIQEGNAPWSPRAEHVAVIRKVADETDKIFVYGGQGSGQKFDDIWSSTDGVTWTSHTPTNSQWTARAGHQAVFLDGAIYLMGGKTASSNSNEVWKSTNGVDFTQLNVANHWSARTQFAALTHNNKIYVIAGDDGSLKNDIWSSLDGVTWNNHGNQEFSARSKLAAVATPNPNGEIWVLGGENGDNSVTNETWHGNLEDLEIKQIEDRKFFSGENRPYAFINFHYDKTKDATNLTHYTVNDSSFARGDTAELRSGDSAAFMHCTSSQICFAFTTDGRLHRFKATNNSISATWGVNKDLSVGTLTNNKNIVHMTSTTSGSTKYLYALADDGSLFRILLKDDGDLNSANEQFQQIPTGKTPTATYAKYKAKVKLVDGSNDEIIITGLANHVVILRKRQQGYYGCCRAGLN